MWKKLSKRPNVGGVCFIGVGTVLRLERNAWSMAKGLRQAIDENPPPSPCFDAVVGPAPGVEGPADVAGGIQG